MKEIPLSQGKVAFVSDHRFDYLNQWKWHINSEGYACCNLKRTPEKRPKVSMQREIMQPPANMEVDHINGNKLDNRDENLRVCTRAQNLRNLKTPINNKSGYKGVYWGNGKWIAAIKLNYQSIYIGSFETPELAARAYDLKAHELFGEFARPNLNKTA